MISEIADAGGGVVRASLGNVWGAIDGKIVDIFTAFHGHAASEVHVPHFNEQLLRLTLLEEIPVLAELAQEFSDLWQTGCVAVLVERSNLVAHVPLLNARLHALALVFGYPTPCDQRCGQVLWDVKVKPVPPGRSATYSEHAGEADLHTDSQFHPVPEEIVCLYVVEPARCGGGVTKLLAANHVRELLIRSTEGAEAYNVLSSFAFPFRFFDPYFLPQPFPDASRLVLRAPIFGAGATIRYRRDVIEAGFELRSSLATPEVCQALRVFETALAGANPVTEWLDQDGLVVLRNDKILHGRTAFRDQGRHLIRVRMSSRPVASHVAAFRSGAVQGLEYLDETVFDGVPDLG